MTEVEKIEAEIKRQKREAKIRKDRIIEEMWHNGKAIENISERTGLEPQTIRDKIKEIRKEKRRVRYAF